MWRRKSSRGLEGGKKIILHSLLFAYASLFFCSYFVFCSFYNCSRQTSWSAPCWTGLNWTGLENELHGKFVVCTDESLPGDCAFKAAKGVETSLSLSLCCSLPLSLSHSLYRLVFLKGDYPRLSHTQAPAAPAA